jgi:hypothetical protein
MLRKRFHWIEGFLAAALLCAIAWLNSTHAAPNDISTRKSYTDRSGSQYGPMSDESEDSVRRLREGTEIAGKTGYFRQDGEGATFVTDDDFELGGLPNLNLERVVRTLKTVDDPETIRWSVDGSITEFSGRNYLFISRAVYKSAAPPPAPEQITNLTTDNP